MAKQVVRNQDARRTKPRRAIVMTPEAWKAADAAALSEGLALSVWFERLVRAEMKRRR